MINIMMMIPNADDATSFYRASGPFSRLRRQMSDISIVFNNVWKHSTVAYADICFLQRPWAPDHVVMAKMAKTLGVPLWVDYDDDLFCVPNDNPAYYYYIDENVRKNIAQLCALADVVTVSTQTLKEKLDPLNKNVIVVNNALDDSLPVIYGRKHNEGPKNKLVFWRGTNTHQKDLMTVAGPLCDISKDNKDWTFQFLGFDPWFITDQMGDTQSLVSTPLEIQVYLEFIQKIQAPFVIVPLIDSPFNRAKSNIAWLEGSLAGMVCIAPALPEFQQPGVLNYRNAEEFESILRKGIAGGFDCNALVKESWSIIEEKFTLKSVNKIREQIIRDLVAGRK